MSTCQHPEYAVVSTLESTPTAPPQERKRPLRTYSRRTIQAVQEQEATRRNGRLHARAESAKRAESPNQHPVFHAQQHAKRETQAGRPSCGSILAYFKPLPSPAGETLPRLSATEPVAVSTEPATSPLSVRTNRRRLTTRPRFGVREEILSNHIEEPINAGNDSTPEAAVVEHRCNLPVEKREIISRPAHGAPREALGEVPANLGHHDGTAGALHDKLIGAKKRRYKLRAKDMTQTTLSLSIHKEPGFTLCGICDILYNPLNEKDRREHNRRHAAFSRKRRRTA
ncbi:hypothetical protein P885DRAFT_70840 [Corynascus similis CBS 632.67]